MDPIAEYRELAIAAGAIDLPRVMASGKLAVRNGDRPVDVVASLQRNRPEMFVCKPTSKRPNRETRSCDRYQYAGVAGRK
jgi:hypothetical protein